MLIPVPAGAVVRALMLAPIVLIVIALMPAILFLPLFPPGSSRRVLGVVKQLRIWHAEVIQTITTGSGAQPVDSGQIKR
ncbi:hypothetical protein [Amycolatopsis sp. cmx-4-68]|uniref:hypothetical protein n=1 Tax=Amycolatopsis sp. cmx-4-68 TaxID=2790938 RepID=UPI00397AFE3C